MTKIAVPTHIALQTRLRHHMGTIVRAAEKDATLLEGSRMDKSQLQNVLNVAEESQDLDVVANFIRYQIGRSGVGPNWQHNDFGLSIVAQLTEPEGVIQSESKAICEELSKQGFQLSQSVVAELSYELMRHYLGYLIRAYVFGTSGVRNAWEHLR